MVGRVILLRTTPPAHGDTPWWVTVVGLLATLPGLLVGAAIVVVRSVAHHARRGEGGSIGLTFKFPGLTANTNLSASPALAYGGSGALLGYRAVRGADTEYSQLRLRSPGGEAVECRYLAAPASIPVAVGDELKLWGSLGRDHVLRGYRLENLSNGAMHKVTLVRPWATAFVAAFVLLCLLIIGTNV